MFKVSRRDSQINCHDVEKISEVIKKIISEDTQIPIRQLSLNDNLILDVGLDSIGLMGLLVKISENHYIHFHLSEDWAMKYKTIGDIADDCSWNGND